MRESEAAEEELRRVLLTREVAGESVASIVARLRTAASSDERTLWERKLESLFLVNGAATTDARSIVLGGIETELAQMIVGGLGIAGTPAAQEALRGMFSSDALSESLRNGVLVTLSLLQSPDPESIAFLRKLASSDDGELRWSACVGLGSMASSIRPDLPRSKDLAGFMRGLEESAVRESALPKYLAALGNSGESANLDIVLRYVESSDPAVRAQALAALRLMEDEGAEETLLRSLKEDSDSRARLTALWALLYRPASVLWPGIDTALRDASFDVRSEAVGWLVSRATSDAEAMQRLEMLAQQDPSEEIRNHSADALRRRRL